MRFSTSLLVFITFCFYSMAGLRPVKPHPSGIKNFPGKTAAGHILTFRIPQQIADEVIDETAHSIGIVVHAGTNITALIPTITVTPGSTVTPASGVPQNFTNAVGYTVDGLTFYSVNVLEARTPVPICNGTSTTIAGDPPGPVSGSYSWEMLNSSGNWVAATGTNTGDDYTTTILSSNPATAKIYSFRRKIVTTFGITYDSYNDLTVNPSVPIANYGITQPSPGSFCVNSNVGIINGNLPTGGNGTYTYQWQISTDNGITFTNIAGTSAQFQSYVPPVLTATTLYRRVVNSGSCSPPVTSNTVTITILNAITNNLLYQPGTVTYCNNATPSILNGNIPSGGTGTFTYQWQSSPDGITYTDIPGATGQDYNQPALTATTYFRRGAASGACSAPVYSDPIIITIVQAISNNVISPPLPNTFCVSGDPGTIQGNIPGGGDGTLHYQWQSRVAGGTFADIPGANGQTYDLPPITVTTDYQRLVTSGPCTVPNTGNIVTITVLPLVANNTITTPATTIFCASADPAVITGSTPAGGDGINYSFQWQSSTDNINFTNIPDATASDYDPGLISATTYYRRSVTSGACITPLYSNVVTISVLPALANNIIAAPTLKAFCQSGNAEAITGLTPTGGDGNYTYQWQQATTLTGTFTDISGETGPNFDPPNLTTSMFYRRVVTNTICTTPLISNVIEIHITKLVTGNTILTPPFGYCVSVDPVNISGSPPGGGDGDGTFIYQWYSSTDNGVTWNLIAGANYIDYDPPTIYETTWYRRDVSSGACTTPLQSNIGKIVVNQTPANVTANPVSPICPNNSATLSVASPDPALTYTWYDSADKSNPLITATSYTTEKLTISKTYTYYVEAANSGGCSSPVLTAVTVTVLAPPDAPVLVNATPVICTGNNTQLNVANPDASLTYNWYPANANPDQPAVWSGPNFITPAINNTTTYYVLAVNSAGCMSAYTTATITAKPAPKLVSAQGTSVCPGGSTSLTATTTDQNVTINWYADATGGISLSANATFTTPNIAAATTYYTDATDNVTGCTSPSRTAVTVGLLQPLPAPAPVVQSVTASTITFQWPAVSGATEYEVSIDNGNTFSLPTSGITGTTQVVSGLSTNQSVTLIVRAYGATGCQTSANSLPVTGTTTDPVANVIFVANAFTPNGDGKNDIVYVRNENIKSLKFYVYDQWGQMLYMSQNQQNGWDGTFKGKPEPSGVYVYYLEAIMNDGKQVKKKGTVTLIR